MPDTTTAPVRFASSTRIPDVLPVYFRHVSPWILLIGLAVAASARLFVGGWSWWDLVIVVAMVGFHPLTEWLIHTFVLHYRPRRIGRWVLDFHLAKEHRRHHRDPRVIDAVFIPTRSLLVIVPVAVVVAFVVLPTPGLALTALATLAAIGNVYEWTHFYVHSGCRPKNRYARYLERAHRLHHYRNEQYWMGVTNHAADHILGTFPDKDEVPASPTAKTLGVD